jgi:hypothetical protein
MIKMPKLISKQRELPEAGKHLSTLVSVEEIENKFFDSQKDKEDKKKRLQWTFEYDDKKGMEIRVWSSSNLTTYKGTMSNALRLVQALMDKELTKEEIEKFEDTDLLIGKKCYLDVKHQKQENGEIFAKVKDFESTSGLPF